MLKEDVFSFSQNKCYEKLTLCFFGGGITVSERHWNSTRGPPLLFQKATEFSENASTAHFALLGTYFPLLPPWSQNWGICALQAKLEGMARCSRAHLGTSGSDCTQTDWVTQQAVAMFRGVARPAPLSGSVVSLRAGSDEAFRWERPLVRESFGQDKQVDGEL